MAYRVMERLVAESAQHLEEIAVQLELLCSLPSFSFDSEDASCWATTTTDFGKVDLSIAFDNTSLHKWDERVPLGCNVSLILEISHSAPLEWDHAWAEKTIVPIYGNTLARILETEVFYCLTRLEMNGRVEWLTSSIVYTGWNPIKFIL